MITLPTDFCKSTLRRIKQRILRLVYYASQIKNDSKIAKISERLVFVR